MPYPHEHAVRINKPNFDEYKRINNVKSYDGIKLPKPIDIIYGRKKTDPKNNWTTQSLRFPIENYNSKDVDKFLKDNKIKYILYDKATLTKKDLQKFSMIKKLPVYKIKPILGEETQLALVDEPAIEEMFMLFNQDKVVDYYNFNEDKMIIKGVALIPNKLIYRNTNGIEHYVTFDEESVQTSAQYFIKNGLKFNMEHTNELIDVELLESYFTKEDNEYGVPQGSWVVSAKVNDKELWNKLKNSENGFSFQSLFQKELIGTEVLEFNKNNNKKMTIKEKLLQFVDTLIFDEEQPQVEEPVVEQPQVEEQFAEQPVVSPEVPTEVVSPEVKDEEQDKEDYYTKEEVDSIVEGLKLEFQSKLDEIMMNFNKVETKVEEFGNQTITQPIEKTIIKEEPSGKLSKFRYK